MLQQFGRAPCPLGHLIPDNYYLRLKGQSCDGETISIRRISPEDYDIHTGHSTTVWRIPQSSVFSEVEISGATKLSGNDVCTELLLSPLTIHWPRSSTAIYENHHFGSRAFSRDWLEFECSLGKVVAQRIDSNFARVRVIHSNENLHVGLSLTLAFSFVASRTVNLIAIETTAETATSRTILPPKWPNSRNRLAPPLREKAEFNPNVEHLLSQAADFFATDTGKQAGNLLHMCFGSVDSIFSTHALVVCVALESMIKLLVKKMNTEPTISDEQRESILTHLDEIGLGDQLVSRFSSFIGKVDETSPKNVLHALAAKRLLGISKDDVKAWDRLRNRIAHGKLLMAGTGKTEDQKIFYCTPPCEELDEQVALECYAVRWPLFRLRRMECKRICVRRSFDWQ